MSRDVLVLPQEMPLRQAAHLLLERQVGGAPVVDEQGRCIGVLSAIDFLRLAQRRADVTQPVAPPLPITCPFQAKHTNAAGREVTVCTLPLGVCPVQVRQTDPDGTDLIVCSQPHCVLADWQVVEVENLPTDEVRRFMTPDPVAVQAATPIQKLARMMIDAHIHRLIVVDEHQRPIGIVSSMNVLAAVAREEPG
jgi:CBS-domain-containing membrane protein